MDYLQEKQKEIKLAQEMVSNRLATDIGDALRKIQERKYDGMQAVPNQSMSQKQPEQSAQQGIQTTIASASKAEVDDKLVKIENFLQRFDKFFSKFYEDTNSRLQDLSKQIIEMNSRINSINTNSVRSSRTEPAQEHQASSSSTSYSNTQMDASSNKEAPKASPRTGRFTDNDVAIDKIFSNANFKMTRK